MKYGYYIVEGTTDTGHAYDDKAECLRFAAKYAKLRKSVVKVFRDDGTFVKSFDGR